MKSIIVTSFFLFIFSSVAFSQNRKIDSLKKVLQNQAEDTVRIKTLNALAWEIFNTGNYEEALLHTNQSIRLVNKELANVKNDRLRWYKDALSKAYNNLGSIHYARGDYSKAIHGYTQSLEIKKSVNDSLGTAMSLNNIGLVHMEKGDYQTALTFFFESLRIRESVGDKKGMASCYNNIGEIHRHKKDLLKAVEYYNKSLRLRQELRDQKGMAYSLNNIGGIYQEQKQYDSAIVYYNKSLEILTGLSDRQGMAQSYNNIGNIYASKGERKQAIRYFSKGLEIRQQIGDKKGTAQSFYNLGILYLGEENTVEARRNLMECLSLAETMNAKPEMKNAYLWLSKVDSSSGNFQRAYEYHKSYTAIKDSIFNEKSQRVMNELQTSYEAEVKDKALLAKDAEIQKQQSEAKQKSLQTIALLVGLSLSLILALMIYRSLKVNRKKNQIILHQKDILEEKQKDITDSIKYAKRIQEAILPPDEHVKSILPDHFIFYQPKDIVSGDFYYVNKDVDGRIIFAAVDCTGHGVPGAFMSIVGHNLLTQSIVEHRKTKPSEILDEVNASLTKTLRQTIEESTVRDGMDIALCSLDPLRNYLQYAGANNPIWIIRNDQIIEIKGDKFPVGIFLGESLNRFTNHEIELYKNDLVYVFSDGYADQFGGERGKKFKYKNLKMLLFSLRHLEMHEQKQRLQSAFEEWKGNLEQVDDICIIGVRV